MSELLRRKAATESVLAKYRHRAFDWADRATCIHLVRAQLVAMGHAVRPVPPFRSALGARRALAAGGFSGLADVFDGFGLPRIAPAEMWLGDIAVVPGLDGFDAALICAGPMMLGWHGDDLSSLKNIELTDGAALTAWRL